MRKFFEWVWTLSLILVVYVSIFVVAEIFGNLDQLGYCTRNMRECL